LLPSGSLSEISRRSELVDGITGKKRSDSKLYYPHDIIYHDPEPSESKQKIIEIIEEIAGAKSR
jgi:hypothetical protein